MKLRLTVDSVETAGAPAAESRTLKEYALRAVCTL